MQARHSGFCTLLCAMSLLANVGCGETVSQQPKAKDAKPAEQKGAAPVEKITKTDAEWKQQLTGEQYYVTRQKGTERPFTGKYWNHHEAGIYKCVGCGAVLFDSTTKFDSGCGWPSFYAPTTNAQITATEDLSHGMQRIEVTCTKCGAHLGHVFDDGPKPTGKRFCINSASLDFEKKK